MALQALNPLQAAPNPLPRAVLPTLNAGLIRQYIFPMLALNEQSKFNRVCSIIKNMGFLNLPIASQLEHRTHINTSEVDKYIKCHKKQLMAQAPVEQHPQILEFSPDQQINLMTRIFSNCSRQNLKEIDLTKWLGNITQERIGGSCYSTTPVVPTRTKREDFRTLVDLFSQFTNLEKLSLFEHPAYLERELVHTTQDTDGLEDCYSRSEVHILDSFNDQDLSNLSSKCSLREISIPKSAWNITAAGITNFIQTSPLLHSIHLMECRADLQSDYLSAKKLQNLERVPRFSDWTHYDRQINLDSSFYENQGWDTDTALSCGTRLKTVVVAPNVDDDALIDLSQRCTSIKNCYSLSPREISQRVADAFNQRNARAHELNLFIPAAPRHCLSCITDSCIIS